MYFPKTACGVHIAKARVSDQVVYSSRFSLSAVPDDFLLIVKLAQFYSNPGTYLADVCHAAVSDPMDLARAGAATVNNAARKDLLLTCLLLLASYTTTGNVHNIQTGRRLALSNHVTPKAKHPYVTYPYRLIARLISRMLSAGRCQDCTVERTGQRRRPLDVL